MRIAMTVALALALASFPAFAQQTQQKTTGNAPQFNAGPITVRGCVNGDHAGYTITQNNTGAIFALQGNVELFQSLRGRQIEVSAHELAPATAADVLPRLDVSQVHPVEGDCPFVAGGAAGAPNLPVPANTPAHHRSPEQTTQPSAATPEYASPMDQNQLPPNAGNNPNVGGDSGAPSPGTGNPPSPRE